MIDIDILKNAIKLTQEGKFDDAEKIYMELLKDNQEDSILLSTIGLFYINIGNYDKSIEYLKKSCSIKETFGNVASYGLAEYERKNFMESAKILEHALEYGENYDIYNKLILSLFEIKSYKKAIEYTEKMCELYPDNPKTVCNKVKSLTQQGKLIEAEICCVEYLKKNQNESSLWYHLGLLKELIYSDDRKAIECYKIAGELGNLGADYNIAVSYQKLGEFEEAEKYYKNFLNIFPNDNEAITSLGMCYLAQKKFKDGYDLFYQRKGGKAEKFTNNLWDGKSELDKDLVILCDQGFGDHVQFIRYIPFLKEHNIKVAVGKQLRELFEKNYPDIEFINYDEVNPHTMSLRITDLAYALNIDFENIPFSEGYLKIDNANIENKKLKVGLCWEAGAAGIRGMINRTINVKCFEPLLNLKNIQVYSFQYEDTFKGNEKYPQMINLAKDFKNFTDTAKALKSMDIVVTVDTVIAHLSGALGLKTYLLLPYAPDWRWFSGDKDILEGKTPWYSSIEIYKQSNPISWEKEIRNIINLLNE